jgi:hypothetical protein
MHDEYVMYRKTAFRIHDKFVMYRKPGFRIHDRAILLLFIRSLSMWSLRFRTHVE